jgi:hypothetical protein
MLLPMDGIMFASEDRVTAATVALWIMVVLVMAALIMVSTLMQ